MDANSPEIKLGDIVKVTSIDPDDFLYPTRDVILEVECFLCISTKPQYTQLPYLNMLTQTVHFFRFAEVEVVSTLKDYINFPSV